MTTPGGKTTIYDAIGGAAALRVAVDQFYDRVLADPDLAGYFMTIDMAKLKAHQRSFLAGALGGAEIFQGRPMKEAHARLKIKPAHFDKVVAHLVDTLTALGIPEPTISQVSGKLAPLKAEIAPHRPSVFGQRKRALRWLRSRAALP